MIYRFTRDRRLRIIARKAASCAGLALSLTALVGTTCPGCPPPANVDGMMRSDARPAPGVSPTPPPTILHRIHHRSITYTIARQSHGVIVISRDGVPWLTIERERAGGRYAVSDPDGSGGAIVTMAGSEH